MGRGEEINKYDILETIQVSVVGSKNHLFNTKKNNTPSLAHRGLRMMRSKLRVYEQFYYPVKKLVSYLTQWSRSRDKFRTLRRKAL